jgi:HPt (histidine-containing phosphotransfer) domain-containing protein
LDLNALRDLRDAGGAEFAAALFAQIRADFARLHDQILTMLGTLASGPGARHDHIRSAVHELKGLALTVGAGALSDACAEAEALAQQKDDAALLAVLPDIIGLCDKVRIELERSIAGGV